MRSMKFLAIDTAGPVVQAALSCGQYFTDADNRNASNVLMPAVDSLLTQEGWTLADVDFLACVVGPGSFTGIRIGVSAVRAMCYACRKKALGVHYLQMLAYNERADGQSKILCVSDGSNGTAYMAEYDGSRKQIRPCVCVSMQEAVAYARAYDGAVCVDEKVASSLPDAIPPDTACKALLRAAADMAGDACSWQELVPVYIRESQAEHDLKAREGHA